MVSTLPLLESGGVHAPAVLTSRSTNGGTVFLGWQDCRFRSGCSSNDIVMSTSTDGASWTTVVRIPIDAASSTVDHFIPGIAVDKTTSGATAHLALTYYLYPTASCTAANCQLKVGLRVVHQRWGELGRADRCRRSDDAPVARPDHAGPHGGRLHLHLVQQ